MHVVRKKGYSKVKLCLHGKQITHVSTIKFVGVMIDEKLNRKAHVSYQSGKISRAIGVIIKARNLCKEALLSPYYTLIYPYLTYWYQVCGSTYQYNIDTLEKLQIKGCSNNVLCKSLFPHWKTIWWIWKFDTFIGILLVISCLVSTTNCYREYLMNALYNMMYFTHMILEMPTCTDSRLLRKVVVDEVFLSVEWKCGKIY